MVNRVGNNPPPGVAQADGLRRAPKRLSNLTAFMPSAPQRGSAEPVRNVRFSGPFMQQNFIAPGFILAANENRTYLFILNTGAGNMYADFSNASIPNTLGVLIPPGGYYEPIRAPTTGVSISGTGVVITSQDNPSGI